MALAIDSPNMKQNEQMMAHLTASMSSPGADVTSSRAPVTFPSGISALNIPKLIKIFKLKAKLEF